MILSRKGSGSDSWPSRLTMQPNDIVDQFTAQVDRFVASPHVNDPEPVARFVAAVAPRV